MKVTRKVGTTKKRSFAAAQVGRLTADWFAPGSSQDTELTGDLVTLRNRSRQMIRDNPHATNIKRIFQNNVVGTGIGIQCQVTKKNGVPDQKINDAIELAWYNWCDRDSCHTAGQLCLNDLLRLVVGAVFQDGEILIRKIHQKFGNSEVPFALEVLESDLLIETPYAVQSVPNNHSVRLGVEVNNWMRPVAYWLRTQPSGEITE